MKIKMSEYFQGVDVTAVLVRSGITVKQLAPGEVYECDSALAEFLLKNRKGVEFSGKAEVQPEPINSKAGQESSEETEQVADSSPKKRGGRQ